MMEKRAEYDTSVWSILAAGFADELIQTRQTQTKPVDYCLSAPEGFLIAIQLSEMNLIMELFKFDICSAAVATAHTSK